MSATKRLLIVTAVGEAATGAALLLSPTPPVALLLGASVDTPGELVVARIAGVALVSIGIACWLARHDEQSRAARGLIGAILFYDIAAAAVLAYADIGVGLSGVGLWPAVLVHAALAIWCVACLRNKRIGLVQ